MVIQYPYPPTGRTILYVPASNDFMAATKEFARKNNTVKHVGAAIVVRDGRIIGRGSIGAGVHGEQGGCIREKMNVPTGTRYDLCKSSSHANHSEASAVPDAKV